MKRLKKGMALFLAFTMLISSNSIAYAAESVTEDRLMQEFLSEELQTADTVENITVADSPETTEEVVNVTNVTSQISEFAYEEINGTYVRITGYTGGATEIQIPSVIGEYIVQEIGAKVFQNNTLIEQVSIPSSVKSIGANAFAGCTSLKIIEFSDGLETIWNSAFYKCTSLEMLNLPQSLKTIYAYAFDSCTALTEISLPNSIETLGYRVFKNCTGLTKANYPMGWKSSPGGNGSYNNERGGIYYGCSNLKKIEIPDGVTVVAPYAFSYCASLTEIILPDSLKEIGSYAFEGCTGLTKVELPPKVEIIWNQAYKDCTGITEFSLPEGLKTVYAYAFEKCTGLNSIKLPDSIETMGFRVFLNCTNLTEVNYPKNWKNTPGGNGSYNNEHGEIFYGCSALKSIRIPEGVTTVAEYAFANGTSLTEVIIPDSVTEIGAYAFAGCTGLKEVELPKNVETIGHHAYENCTGLTKMIMPEGVKEIYAYAFGGCSGLKSILLPDSVETLGYRVFNNSINLTEVNYPKNWKNTPGGNGSYNNEHGGIFYGCTNLRNLTIPEGVTEIPANAFQNCGNLEKVTLSESVQKIGNYAFGGCGGLEHIWIGEQVSQIGANSFENCNNLIIHGVAGSYAESYAATKGYSFSTELIEKEENILCGYVKNTSGKGIEGIHVSIYYPEKARVAGTVTTDANGYWEFNKAMKDSLYSIRYHHASYGFAVNNVKCTTVTEKIQVEDITAHLLIDETEEENQTLFTYSAINGSYIRITGYTGSKTNLVIPGEIDGYVVQEIGTKAFQNNKTIQSVVLPAGVTTIKDYAFAGCTALKNVGFSENLQIIWNSAFYGCTSLVNVNLPGNLKTIYAYAFDSCTALTEISLPDSIETLGYRVFKNCTGITKANYPMGWKSSPGGNGSYNNERGGIYYGCSNLKKIEIPDGVTVAAPYAFSYCTSLIEITLPDSLKEIGSYAFEGCTGLTKVELPSKVETIWNQAYKDCTGITEISLPEGLKTIYAYAFEKCTGLNSIKLPDSVETMGFRVFLNCTNLTEVNYPKNWKNTPGGNGSYNNEHGEIFYGCTSLKSIRIPEGVTTVAEYAFANGKSLTEVVIPESVTEIGAYAFAGCTGLKEVELPKNIETIGHHAYENCTGLTKMIMPEGVKTIYAYAFGGCSGLKNIVLPDSIETLGYRVFNNCNNLTEVNYPKNWVNTPGGNGSYNNEHGGIFYGCTNLRNLIIPEGVTEIPANAFQNCGNLEKVTLAESVQKIGNYAFGGCGGLEHIWIGEQVSQIGANSFENCNNLTIHGAAGSYAESYASDKGFVFSTEVIEKEEEILCGYVKDTQGNGLEQIKVSVYYPKKARVVGIVTTDANGYWEFDKAVSGGLYSIRYHHTNYGFSVNNVKCTAVTGVLQVNDVIGKILIENTEEENSSFFTYSVLNGSYIKITGYTGSKTNLVIPNEIDGYVVQEIGSKVFQNNKTLQSVVIPANVITIGDYAFAGCTALKSVGFSENLQTIWNSAFYGCTSLVNVNLPGNLKTIYAYAFDGCTALTEISLPDSIETLGYRVFKNCTGITKANYPMGWKSSPGGNGSYNNERGGIYYGCSNLKKVEIPDGVTVAAPYAFSYCTSLTEITLPDSLKEIGSYAFEGCTGLTKVELPSKVEIIWNQAYKDCTGITEIRLPEGLKTIYAYAFEKCTGLNSIKLPDSVETMGFRVFLNCTNLTEVNYPKNWKNTPGGNGSYNNEHGEIFYGCTSLKSIRIPEGVTTVAEYAFANGKSLTEVIIPESVTEIGAYAFAGCTGLKEVELPKNVETIGHHAYENCTGLTKMIMPEGVKTVYAYAFGGCSGLERIMLPDSIETLGFRVFNNCTNLKEVNYPKNWVNTPGGNGSYNNERGGIFYGCTSLRNFTISEEVTEIPAYAFQNCGWLRRVNVGSTVTKIGDYAFDGCKGLPSISLNANLETIGKEAFKNCDGLLVLNVPEKVSSIGDNAFAECDNLGKIYLGAKAENIGKNIFQNTPDVVIYCNYYTNATLYAIQNGIPFMSTGTFQDSELYVLDREKTSFYADFNGMTTNGYVAMSINYGIKDQWIDQVSNMQLEIHLPRNGEFFEETLMVDGKLCTNYQYDGKYMLKIPISQKEGVVKFSIKVLEDADISSYVKFQYTEKNTVKNEILGIINEAVSIFTLDAPQIVSKDRFTISGIAPSESTVTLSVNGKEQKTVNANKAGAWTTELSLENPKDYYYYHVQAVCLDENGVTQTQKTTVTYHQGEPSLSSLKMYYDEHNEIKSVNLMNQGGTTPVVYFLPNTEFVFEAKFENAEQIEELYITSTRNNETKYLKATYDEEKDAFVTEGFFDENNHGYVPGSISYEYRKEMPKVYVGQDVDWNSMLVDFPAGAPECVEVVKNTDTDYQAIINLADLGLNIQNVALDTQISIFDMEAGTDLGDWKGLLEENENILSYILEGYNDEKYIVNLDYSNPDTWLMLIKDVSGNKYIGYTLSTMQDNAENLDEYWDLTKTASTISTISTVSSLLYENYQIEKDMDQLRSEVLSSGNYSSSEELNRALEKVDELEMDQKWFLLMTTVLPLIVAAPITVGATMSAAPMILFTAILGTISASSAFFWNARKADIKGEKFKLKFVIDPSGYVYDDITEERLENVTVTAYCIEYDESEDFWTNEPSADEYGTKWNAEEYNQKNPLMTNADGKYAWDVPEGWWRVKYEKEGYETTWSDWMTVPPVQTEVNIGMRSLNGAGFGKEDVYRIAGKTRYETSLKIASVLKEQQKVGKFDTVIIANGRNFPDALAGSYLAGKLDAPILMANEKAQYADPLRSFVRENLKEGGIIYVLGGTGAVPESVLQGLEGFTIKRLAGKTRYETNLLILNEAGVGNEEILVCTGKGFADSLSASATGKPILLVGPTLTEAQLEFLEEHQGNQYYVIGGSGAVSNEIESIVRSYGETERIAGASRYETSVKVAEKFFMNPNTAVLASAKNFPDGLCGGPLAMSKKAPLILTATGKEDLAAVYAKTKEIGVGAVLGGDGLISDAATNSVFGSSGVTNW